MRVKKSEAKSQSWKGKRKKRYVNRNVVSY